MTDKKHIVITESHRILSDTMKEAMGARCISFTFLPFFTQRCTNGFIPSMDDVFIGVSNPSVLRADGISKYELEKDFTRVYQKNVIALILDLSCEDGDFILAHDNDAGGNMMASLLYYKLIHNGVSPTRIKRIIGMELTVRGGMKCLDTYAGSFYPQTLLMSVLSRYQKEQEDIRKYAKIDKRLRRGYRNIVALHQSFNKIGATEEIIKKSNGTALATYLTNGVLDGTE